MISASSDAKIKMFGLFLLLNFSSEKQTLYLKLKLFVTMATSGFYFFCKEKIRIPFECFMMLNERNCTKTKKLKKTVLRPS